MRPVPVQPSLSAQVSSSHSNSSSSNRSNRSSTIANASSNGNGNGHGNGNGNAISIASPVPKRASSTRSKRSSSSTLSTATTATATTTTTTTTTITSSSSYSYSSSSSSLAHDQPPTRPGTKRTTLVRADKATLHPEQQQQQQQHSLRHRESSHHVLSLTPTTRSASTDASNMPPADRSRQSQLGASAAAKSTGRPPLVAKGGSVVVKPPPGHTPPASRPYRDDAATTAPTVAYVNTVAARSGPRPTRGNSAGTTPIATPNPDRYSADRSGDSWESPSRPPAKPPLIRNESHAFSRQSHLDLSAETRSDSSKFFYASEAKPPASISRASPGQQKAASTSTFFYASEAPPSIKRNSNPSAAPSNPPSTLGTPTPQETAAPKFFYANGAPETSSAHSKPPLAAVPSSGSGSGSASNASTTSRLVPGRPGTGNATPGLQRPESPAKVATTHSPQNSRNSSLMLPTSPTRSSVYAPSSISSTTNASRRRVSIEAPPLVAKGHGRSGSAGADTFSGSKYMMPTVVSPEMPVSSAPALASAPVLTPVISMASILQVTNELEDGDAGNEDDEDESNDDDDDDNADHHDDDDEDNSEEGEDGSEDDSDKDSYSGRQRKEPLSDYVLSARRERKVQDLEIRNTSLEAINKTLERQLRKQSAELRRFRRLSRAGKLPDASASKDKSGRGKNRSDLSDLSEEESVAATNDGKEGNGDDDDDNDNDDDDDDEEEEEEDNSFVSEESSSTASGSGSRSDDVSRHKRDERRLELDLTRHRELLKDSQKINQSLKRCLNWTGELIKEGQKALAYQVRVSDMQQFGYGGRVLRPDEDDDDTSHQADETLTNADSDAESAAEPWTKGPQDRDSGIELPVDSG